MRDTAPRQAAAVPRLALRSYVEVNGAGAQGCWGGLPRRWPVVWNSLAGRRMAWREGWGRGPRGAPAGVGGCKHADTLKARNRWNGAGRELVRVGQF